MTTEDGDWLSKVRKELDKLVARHKHTALLVEEEKVRLQKEEEELKNTQTAQAHLQNLAQATQQQSHKQIARVVSKCLSAVFEEPYELRIEFVRKRGRTEAEFTYLRGGYKVRPRVTSGGVKQVASLALRLASLVMTIPQARRLLILDEPFNGLSFENKEKMACLIKSLSEELGMQFIIVTHDREFQIGKVIDLG